MGRPGLVSPETNLMPLTEDFPGTETGPRRSQIRSVLSILTEHLAEAIYT